MKRVRLFMTDDRGLFLMTCKPSEMKDYLHFGKRRQYKHVGTQVVESDSEPYNWSKKYPQITEHYCLENQPDI